MDVRKIVLVFLCTFTGKALLEAAESDDKDNPCGPSGTFNCFDGRCACYMVINFTRHYEMVSKLCQRYQGQLVSISSQEEKDFVASLMEKSNITSAWIGMYRDNSDENFRWVDESTFSLSAVRKDGHASWDNCVRFSLEHGWLPSNCIAWSPFICEVPYEPTQLATKCPFRWAPLGKYCYFLEEDLMTWDEAHEQCQAYEANLVSIHSEEENNLTKELLVMHNLHKYWTGFRRVGKTKQFRWVDGSAFDYADFNIYQPDNYGDNEDCVEVRLGQWTWNDLPCSRELPAICKMELNPKKE